MRRAGLSIDRKFFVCLLTLGIAATSLVACGGKKTPEVEEAASTTSTIGTIATTVPPSTRVSPDITIPPAPGSENSAFCAALNGGLGLQLNAPIEPEATSDGLKSTITKTMADLKAQASNVPDDMANQFVFVTAYYERINAALELTNYDITKLVSDDALYMQLTPSDDENNSLVRFLRYQQDVCSKTTSPAITAP